MLNAYRSGDDGIQRKFFRERQGLGFLRGYSSESPSVDYQNIDGLCGAIIADGKATLHELRTVYTLEDAFDMFEVIAVTRYNEHLAMQHAQKKR